MKLRKGDNVTIISGNSKGKTGVIEKTIPNKNKVVISGVNIVTKHIKPSKMNRQTGIIKKTMPIDISNVSIICSNCKKNTRIKFMIRQNEKRRICSRCKEAI